MFDVGFALVFIPFIRLKADRNIRMFDIVSGLVGEIEANKFHRDVVCLAEGEWISFSEIACKVMH